MRKILTPEQMRAAERRAMNAGEPGIELMERAAVHVAAMAQNMAEGAVLVLCGTGNNGGDGLAAARLLHRRGIDVEFAIVGNIGRLSPDAQTNWERLIALGFSPTQNWQSKPYALVVDALFGTGLTRAPEGDAAAAIRWMNECGAKVLAVDVPSGVDARDGSTPGACVRADTTVTFHAAKAGLLLFPGRAQCGEVVVADIGLAADEGREIVECLDEEDVAILLPPRAMDTHKGDFGRLLLVAGSYGMAGAAALCARGALHTGAGLTTVATVADVVPIVQTLAPEATAVRIPDEEGMPARGCGEHVARLLAGRDVVAIGPGMTAGEGTREAVLACLASGLPCVVDADGLNVLVGTDVLPREGVSPVLTPHPGEMTRLLGRAVGDPIADAQSYAERSGAVVLLKGATTVIAAPDGRVTLNITGAPAMARGGSGDVLTGIVAALLAQGLSPYDAARLGAFLHGRAGERAQRKAGLAMTPLDLPRYLYTEQT